MKLSGTILSVSRHILMTNMYMYAQMWPTQIQDPETVTNMNLSLILCIFNKYIYI